MQTEIPSRSTIPTEVRTIAQIVADDLLLEGAEVDAIVCSLTDEQWSTPTPAVPWTIAHQIAHLAWTDQASLMALKGQEAFAPLAEAALRDPVHAVDDAAYEWARIPRTELLAAWRLGRVRLHDVLSRVPAGQQIPWFGPSMSAASMATARLMETWAHGTDIADALSLRLPVTDRLKHIAHMGVRPRNYAYRLHSLTPPEDEFRIELTTATGANWTWGPPGAAQRVCGTAWDFCMLVTQRRHRDDLSLVAVGEDADRWLAIAQVFAGPPGNGRASRDLP